MPEGSPAAQAGLEAHTDYIVGSPEVVFNSETDFHNLLKVPRHYFLIWKIIFFFLVIEIRTITIALLIRQI